MTVEQLVPGPPPPAPARSETRFPGYALPDGVMVANTIHVKGGGTATADQLAAHLGYKGTNNGAFITKVAAARMFGLVAKSGNVYLPTPLAHRIITPVYPHDSRQALVEAFLNIELFRRIHDDFKGRELPPEFGLKNALRNTYGILPLRVDIAYRTLLDSADAAGFFATRMGARTQLIMPSITPPQAAQGLPEAVAEAPAAPATGGGGGGGGGHGGKPPSSATAILPVPTAQLAEVKAQYVATLIRLFEQKSAMGELDEKLMERIERLL